MLCPMRHQKVFLRYYIADPRIKNSRIINLTARNRTSAAFGNKYMRAVDLYGQLDERNVLDRKSGKGEIDILQIPNQYCKITNIAYEICIKYIKCIK